ncbi:MAG: ABC transporter ATP-binding protein [Synergistaceae bacterium]|jgi:peptide/nickel transport system ATP-binding protein|nr:ABC transporter ATP-binding protein [Synergistaceae bacterium]
MVGENPAAGSHGTMDERPLLKIRDLWVEYRTSGGTVKAVNGLNMEITMGETLGFVGETGAGKSTTAFSVMRILPDPPAKVVKGQIMYQGEDLLRLGKKQMRAVRGKEIAMIFQDPMTSLDPVKTVAHQIQEMIALHENLSRMEARAKAENMLEVVGIRRERANDYPHQFSGGMKQRVVIAIALSCNPKLLIADEPTTALDVTIQMQVLELMKKLKNEYRMSMIMITHDLGVVAEICDSVAVMYAGNVVERGTTVDVFESPSHPYTRALFDAVPDIGDDKHELKVISGAAHNPTKLPEGCHFHPRCPVVLDICRFRAPRDFEVSPGHTARCFLCDTDRMDKIAPEASI